MWMLLLVVACGGGEAPIAAPAAPVPVPDDATGATLKPVQVDALYGFARTDGSLQIPARFAKAMPFSESLAPVCVPIGDPAVSAELQALDPGQECFWGFVNPAGELAIQPGWVAARGFSEARAAVARLKVSEAGDFYIAWQLIDATGAALTEAKYSSLGDVHDGLTTFQVARPVDPSTPAGFLDASGAVALQVPGVTQVLSFGDGVAPMLKDGKWGFVDHSGAWVLEPRWVMVTSFVSGVAAVRETDDGTWRYIEPDGSQAFPGEFTAVGVFEDGVAVVRTTDGRTLQIDPTGAEVHAR